MDNQQRPDPRQDAPPPAHAAMDQQQESKSQQPKQQGPTLDELHRAWLEGGEERLGQMLTRADGGKMIPSPEDLTLAYYQKGAALLDALMSHMDGLVDEDDPDPAWGERRWR